MRIKSHAPVMHLGMAAAGLGTLGLIGTYAYLMWANGRAGILLSVVVAPFLMMGSLLAFFGVRGFIRQAWLGSWQLEIPDEGCVLGQRVSARLFPRREVVPTGELQCRLRCVRFVPHQDRHTASGSNVTTLWHLSWTMPSATIHPTRGLSLSLQLPETGQPTVIDRKGGVNFTWQLNVVIASAGRSEEPVFDLPVRS